MAKGKKKSQRKKKKRRNVTKGQMHVKATFNNTIITFTDEQGRTLASSSAGACGFKGSRKGTGYAAQIASEEAAKEAKEYGLQEVEVFIKGIGSGRESAVRALMGLNIEVTSITDATGVPHNGCRPRKARRI